eukprot:TRINITY_DN4936_c0_g2_i7.p2 TRINITY_DN4936_c0_g2~~TRINITY_DN4936_c0_g2_i7.p2  ORF type:complete len:206 (+),score=-12.44 TRINITY_DN4936_c0_g2_i7:198-815(+)
MKVRVVIALNILGMQRLFNIFEEKYLNNSNSRLYIQNNIIILQFLNVTVTTIMFPKRQPKHTSRILLISFFCFILMYFVFNKGCNKYINNVFHRKCYFFTSMLEKKNWQTAKIDRLKQEQYFTSFCLICTISFGVTKQNIFNIQTFSVRTIKFVLKKYKCFNFPFTFVNDYSSIYYYHYYYWIKVALIEQPKIVEKIMKLQNKEK